MGRNAPYGTPFAALEDEDGPVKKKPKKVHEEVVTDERGRRRFHGAFTGGFSAGYFNSVGSKHGWVPSTFKSSRDRRAEVSQRRPEDFMDEEDLGEFGISSRQFHVNKKYAPDRPTPSTVPEPISRVSGKTGVVDDLFHVQSRSESDSIGLRIMRLMGHRDGKGIGAPLSRRALELQRLAEQRAMRGKKSRFDRTAVEEAEEFARSFEFIPEDVPPVYFSSQDNTHGLGYSGLKGLSGGYNTVTGEQAGGSKRGDAFGVGVFEDSDDDVYDADDLSGYNKVLGDRDPILAITSGSAANVGEISFVPAKKTRKRPTYEPIVVPPGFNPRHTPIPFDPSCLPVEVHAYGSRMTPLQKAMILGEKATSIMDLLSQEDRQKLREARRLVEERKNAPKPAKKVSEAPKNIFSSNPEKAQRFDQFLMCLRRGSAYHRQPGLTDAEWAREEADFQRAVPSELRHLLPAAVQRAQPLFKGGGLTESLLQAMKNKFVATSAEPKADDVKPKQKPPLTLVSHTWHPAKRLCVRLNVPDPYPNSLLEGIPGRVSVSKTPKGGFTTTAIEQEIARQRRGFFPEDEPSSSQQEATDENPPPAAESTAPPESEPLFEFFDFMDSIFGTTDAEVRESEQAQAELSAERPREDPKPLATVQSSSEAKAGDIQLRERPKKVIQLMDDDDEEDGAPVFQPGASRVPVRPKEPPAPLTGPKEGFREEMSAEKLSSPVLKVPAPVPAPEVKVEEVLPAEVSTQTVSDSSDVRSSSEEERKRKKHRNRKKKEREEREREREHRKKKEKKSKKRDRHRDRDRDEDEDDRKSRKSKKDKKEKHRREHSSSSRSRSKSKSSKSKRHHHHRSRHDRSRSRSESNSTLPSIASDSG